MENTYEPNYRIIDEIYLKEIVFEKSLTSTDVTIFGYYKKPFKEKLQRVDYYCEFGILNDLLIFSKEIGDPIIDVITEKLNDDDPETSLVIDVENLYGKPLKIDNIVLTIYRPFEENENGEWVEVNDDEEFYIIDSVESKEIFKEKNSKKRNFKNDFEKHLILLISIILMRLLPLYFITQLNYRTIFRKNLYETYYNM